MSQRESEETSTSFPSWPLSGGSLAQDRYDLLSESPHFDQSHHKRAFADRTIVNVKKSGADAIPKFHLPFRSKSHGHGVSSHFPRLSTVHEASYERTALSLDLDRRLAQSEDARYCEDGAPSSGVRLRGGGNQRQAGKLKWLKTTRSFHKTPDECKCISSCSGVTYKGRQIGSPQPAPALNVLPPASRFARELDSRAAFNTASSPLNNSDDILANDSPTPLGRDDRVVAYLETPPLPLPPGLLATPSRPVTSNPFASVYGNPHAIRAGPICPPIDYEVVGFVDRPSALVGSQTGYESGPKLRRRSPLRLSDGTTTNIREFHESAAKFRAQQVRTDRKWDALPPLPREEGAPEPPLEDIVKLESEGADNEPFNTEEVLSLLRPERLSLYHIGTPGRSANGLTNAGNACTATTEWPAQAVTASTRIPTGNSAPEASDSYSVCTRDWDLHSCNTDYLDIDNRPQRQERLARHSAQRPLPQEQQQQINIRDNNEALYGLPEEDAPTPESFFYADMMEIVNDYHEQLQKVIQRAYEVVEISEEHWLHERWRHRTAMDRKLRAAEEMSGYKILTNEVDIKEAIKQPTGSAIYSSLLRIRDPETWQRIFEPATTYSHLGTITSTTQQHTSVQKNSLMWLVRKIGRGLRFILAVPDDPDLKTYSSRHPPAPPSDIVTYQSNAGVLGPNIPLRPLETNEPTVPAPTVQFLLSRSFAPISDQPRPSTQTEQTPKLSNETTRVNNNTVFTDTALASPLNDRIIKAPRSRGYEQGAFVTIVAPSVVSNKSEKTTAGYGAGRPGGKRRVRDDETEVTAWPEADC